MVAMRASVELASSAPLVLGELGRQEHCYTFLGAARSVAVKELYHRAAACCEVRIDRDWLSPWVYTGRVLDH